jgi:hypothetical protein
VRAAKLALWQRAYTSFLQAWRLKQHYQIAANLGRAELKLRKYRDAAEHLTYFLREASAVGPDERKAAQAMLDEARAKVGALTIIVDRPGAVVLVDGVAIGRCGHPTALWRPDLRRLPADSMRWQRRNAVGGGQQRCKR